MQFILAAALMLLTYPQAVNAYLQYAGTSVFVTSLASLTPATQYVGMAVPIAFALGCFGIACVVHEAITSLISRTLNARSSCNTGTCYISKQGIAQPSNRGVSPSTTEK